MELRIPTREQLCAVYARDMVSAFVPADLRALRNIEKLWDEGWYLPYCLFDGEEILGECFMCVGEPGWAVLDYLCVPEHLRNGGLGGRMLSMIQEIDKSIVVLGECEAPIHAEDPELAARRLNFYLRSGARLAGYDVDMYGTHDRTLYWADRELPDEELMKHHVFIHRHSFAPDKFEKYILIPRDPEMPPRTGIDADDE